MKIRYNTAKNINEAFEKVQRFVTPALFQKYNINPRVDYQKDINRIVATGQGFEFKINFYEQDLEFDLDVGLLLRPFKGKILEKIENEIKGLV